MDMAVQVTNDILGSKREGRRYFLFKKGKIWYSKFKIKKRTYRKSTQKKSKKEAEEAAEKLYWDKILELLEDEVPEEYFVTESNTKRTIRCFKTGLDVCPKNVKEIENQVFVGMPFAKEYKSSFEKAIRPALKENGFEPWKADEIIQNIDLMCKICGALQESSCALINISDWNPNVIYELGLAHGFGLSTFIIKQKDSKIPTDLSGMEYTSYSNARDLKVKLSEKFSRVKETIWENKLLFRIYNLQIRIKTVTNKLEINSKIYDNLAQQSGIPQWSSNEGIWSKIDDIDSDRLLLNRELVDTKIELNILLKKAEKAVFSS